MERTRRSMPLLLALLLAGCAVSPPQKSGPRLTHFAFSDTTLALHGATPLGTNDWMARRGEARVPVFATGTAKREVLAGLRGWGLEPLEVADSIVVQEGPSRHGFGMRDPAFVVYGFEDERLNVGPLNETELVTVLLYWHLGSGDFELLANLDLVAPLSAGSLNDAAWGFATHPDRSRRVPALALILASRANAMSNWQNPVYLDTMAAAAASAGDFDRAIALQLEAVLFDDGQDPSIAERLSLYESGRPYVVRSAVHPFLGPPATPAGLVERAEDGDADAQFALGAFCLEHRIEDCGGAELTGTDWVTRAARAGLVAAVVMVGQGHARGAYGLARNDCAARDWLQRGVAADSRTAHYLLAGLYRDGACVDRDEAEVNRLLRLAAEGGLPEAALELGFRLREGVGGASDVAAAERWWSAAAGVAPEVLVHGSPLAFSAELVDAAAQAALPPLAVPTEAFTAHLMAQVAAIEAQLRAGDDVVTARFPGRLTGWLRRDADAAIFQLTHGAARLGSAAAQRKLADLYARGVGVALSALDADYWHHRAANNATDLP